MYYKNMKNLAQKINRTVFFFLIRLRTLKWWVLFKDFGKDTIVYGSIKVLYPENVSIGDNSRINDFVYINGRGGVKIGSRVHISASTTINTSSLDYNSPLYSRSHFNTPVSIGDGTWIAQGVIINPGVSIGPNCVIGAGSVVTDNIPEGKIAYGVPARVVRDTNSL
jgi:acetyltransferase-like isoleucine patch superfamily enzyme